MKIRDFLFKGFEPCTNGNCIIKKPKGMHTNASCSCLRRLKGVEINILSSRISEIVDKEIEVG